MRTFLLIPSLVFLLALGSAPQTNQYGCANPYPISLARALLEIPRGLPPGVVVEVGVTEKELYRSGDVSCLSWNWRERSSVKITESSTTGEAATGASMNTTVGFPVISGCNRGKSRPSSAFTWNIPWKAIGD